MIHHETHDVETILTLISLSRRREVTLPSGATFRVSDRIRNFMEKGIQCVTCRIEGSFFVLESVGDEKPHLNLYAINSKGKHILMTKDHIIPKSKGGLNALSNYVPMCSPCNGAKADTL